MPLNSVQAASLLQELLKIDRVPTSTWDFNFPIDWRNTYTELEIQLIELRKEHLNRKSFEMLWHEPHSKSSEIQDEPEEIVDESAVLKTAHEDSSPLSIKQFSPYVAFQKRSSEKKVRVFPASSTPSYEIDDIFARGIDTMRGFLEILQLTVPGQIHVSPVVLSLFKKFQKNCQLCGLLKENQLKLAIDELALFQGALIDFLLQENIFHEKKQAKRALFFMRDFLWKRDMSQPSLVLENELDETNDAILRFSEPLSFDSTGFRLQNKKNGKEFDLWAPDTTWRRELSKALGDPSETGWMHSFFEKHLLTLRQLSTTPSSRATPNPANAFDCTDIIVKYGSIVHISSHTKIAVTKPLDVRSKHESEEITHWNHLQLLNPARLEPVLNCYLQKWGDLYSSDEPIPITLLHQTFIADEVLFSPDHLKAKTFSPEGSVIDTKLRANHVLRDFLKNSVILRDSETGKLQFLSRRDYLNKYSSKPPEGFKLVQITVLDTNNCINMWNKRSRVRNNDLNDSRQLIQNLVQFVSRFDKLSAHPHLKTVVNFLNSWDHSIFFPSHVYNKKIKNALNQLIADLRDEEGPLNTISASNREEIALSIHAAMELKCLVHETWAGSLRRVITNFTRDYFRQFPVLGHLVDWTIRLSLFALTLPFKLMLSLPHWFKHRSDRKVIYKAAYEGILAETMGILQGGCMSSADRAGEMAEQRMAFKKQFAETGRILSFNDSKEEENIFFQRYGSTKAKHFQVEMATGSIGTKDSETRGIVPVNLMSEHKESKEEKRLSEMFSSMRKMKFKDISYTKYTKSRPQSSLDLDTGADKRLPLVDLDNNLLFKEIDSPEIKETPSL